MLDFRFQRLLAGALATIMLVTSLNIALAHNSLEEERASYDAQAERLAQESAELQGKIDSLSEEKRLLDEEANVAITRHKTLAAELQDTLSRLESNEQRLEEVEADYEVKSNRLSVRIRDIYINGSISYVDVLFGAKDFTDLLTRMDLLKRIINQDYELVREVMLDRDEIATVNIQLKEDKEKQEKQEVEARTAREDMEEKVERQRAIIERMENDKATIDRQHDELRAASERITNMLLRSSIYGMPAQGNGSMIWPIAGPITSDFGWRVHPITGTQNYHSGIDIGGDYGDTIVAAQTGTVEYAGWISGYGYTVIINHGGGISTLYAHCQELWVATGDYVNQGERIADCGSTGNSTGPHCHFEVRVGGEPVNPLAYL